MTEVPLSRNQMAVAAAVTASHATVRAGFVVLKVDATTALACARAATRRLRTLVGLPELTMQALAALRFCFPSFFAGSAANVAVTVDVGAGLYLPVVADADRIGLRGISRTLLEYRSAARRGTFRAAQLSGATIALALATDGPLYSKPIIFPGLTCAVSLGSTVRELRRDPSAGGIAPRSVVHVGLSYDHRTLTASSACRFLAALKTALESSPAEDVNQK